MSAQRVLDILGGILIGGGVGAIATKYLLENKLHEEYIAQVGSMRRALEAARIDAVTPVATEEELEGDVTLERENTEDAGVVFTGGGEILAPALVSVPDVPVQPDEDLLKEEGDRPNPYWTAVNSDGPSFTMLEEEDYYEEDGRLKEQLVMIFAEGHPTFFAEGQSIDDWKDRVGTSVVDDMRKEAERSGSPVLYIRNNKTDIDYEVIFEQP